MYSVEEWVWSILACESEICGQTGSHTSSIRAQVYRNLTLLGASVSYRIRWQGRGHDAVVVGN